MKKLSVLLAVLMLLALISGCGKEEAPKMGATMDFDAASNFSIDPVETFDSSNAGAEIELDIPDFSIEPVETYDTSNIGTSDIGSIIEFEAPTFDIPEYKPIDTTNIGAKIDFAVPSFEIPVFEPIDIYAIDSKIDFSPIITEIDLNIDTYEIANDISTALPEEESQKMQELEPVEIEKIVNIQLNLLRDLQLAFEQVGMPIHVNETTGEITMDSAVLFGFDQSEVSPEGKQLLQQFMHVYSYVVFNEKYEDYVSKVIIEGHTDSTGTYAYNQKLSQARADQVLAYVLSDECGLPAEHQKMLKDTAMTIGYSCDRPILDAQGKEVPEVSRRVCFRFLISLQ